MRVQDSAGAAGIRAGRGQQIGLGIDRDGSGLDAAQTEDGIDRQPRGGPAVVHRLLIVVADIDVDLTAALRLRGQIGGDGRLPVTVTPAAPWISALA